MLRLNGNIPEIKSFTVSPRFHRKPECPVLNQVDRVPSWIMISNANGDLYLLDSRGLRRFQQVSSISFIIIFFQTFCLFIFASNNYFTCWMAFISLTSLFFIIISPKKRLWQESLWRVSPFKKLWSLTLSHAFTQWQVNKDISQRQIASIAQRDLSHSRNLYFETLWIQLILFLATPPLMLIVEKILVQFSIAFMKFIHSFDVDIEKS